VQCYHTGRVQCDNTSVITLVESSVITLRYDLQVPLVSQVPPITFTQERLLGTLARDLVVH